MFTNAKVGDRVISKFYGTGTISALILEDDDYPINVTFDNIEVSIQEYSIEGLYFGMKSSGYGEQTERNIIPLRNHNKLGSTDARRIVAMLASEYRILRNTDIANHLYRERPVIRNENGTRCFIAKSSTLSAFSRYTEAKQLLEK